MRKHASAFAVIFALGVAITFYQQYTELDVTPSQSQMNAARQLQIDPYAAATALYLANDYEDAIGRYRHALQADPAHPAAAEARYRIARCLEETGKLHEAQIAYRSFLEQYPNDSHAPTARKRMAPLVGLGMTN